MYVVKHVDSKNDMYYSAHSFDTFDQAFDFMCEQFLENFGDVVREPKIKFWDPIYEDQSANIFSVEMFAPNETEGFYLYKDWESIQ